MSEIIPLSPLDLSLAAILIVLLAGLTIVLRLQLWSHILIAGLRTTVQLLLIGLLLEWIFAHAER